MKHPHPVISVVTPLVHTGIKPVKILKLYEFSWCFDLIQFPSKEKSRESIEEAFWTILRYGEAKPGRNIIIHLFVPLFDRLKK